MGEGLGVGLGVGVGVGVGEGEGVGVGVAELVGDGEGVDARLKTLPARYDKVQTVAVSPRNKIRKKRYLKMTLIYMKSLTE